MAVNEVRIDFTGESRDAEAAAASIDRVLEQMEALAREVSRALDGIRIDIRRVMEIQSAGRAIGASLRDVTVQGTAAAEAVGKVGRGFNRQAAEVVAGSAAASAALRGLEAQAHSTQRSLIATSVLGGTTPEPRAPATMLAAAMRGETFVPPPPAAPRMGFQSAPAPRPIFRAGLNDNYGFSGLRSLPGMGNFGLETSGRHRLFGFGPIIGGGESIIGRFGGGGGGRGGIGGFFSRGGGFDGGLLGGILPGGARPGPAAVGALSTLGLAAAPNLLPAIIGPLAAIPGLAGTGVAALGTLVAAFHGVGKAIGGDAAAYKKLNEEQQEFVRTARGLSPILSQIKEAASSSMIPGVTAGLRAAFSPAQQSTLTKGVGLMGGAIGGGAAQFGNLVGGDFFTKLEGDLFKNGAANVRELGDAFTHLVSAVTSFAHGAQPITDWLVHTIDLGSRWLANWTRMKDETQAFDGYLERTKTAWSDIAGLVGGLGRVVGDLAGILGGSGQSAIEGLIGGLDELDHWLKENRDELKTLADTITNVLIKALTLVLQYIKGVADGVSTLIDWLGKLPEPVKHVSEMAAAFGAASIAIISITKNIPLLGAALTGLATNPQIMMLLAGVAALAAIASPGSFVSSGGDPNAGGKPGNVSAAAAKEMLAAAGNPKPFSTAGGTTAYQLGGGQLLSNRNGVWSAYYQDNAVSVYGIKPGYTAAAASNFPGTVRPGNIDLDNRPVAHNADGSISTVRSITVGIDGGRFALLPTVVNGKVVSNQAAIDYYRKTGQNLGIFSSERAADRYAEFLHQIQAVEYAGARGGGGGAGHGFSATGAGQVFAAGKSVDLMHEDPALMSALNQLSQTTGLRFQVTSGYRSFDKQKYLWDNAAKLGLIRGVTVAKPGTSDHETGRAADVMAIVNGRAIPITQAVSAGALAQVGLSGIGAADPVHVKLAATSQGGVTDGGPPPPKPGTWQLPMNLQIALARARAWTPKNTADDVTAIGAAIRSVRGAIPGLAGEDLRNAYQELKSLQDMLVSIGKAPKIPTRVSGTLAGLASVAQIISGRGAVGGTLTDVNAAIKQAHGLGLQTDTLEGVRGQLKEFNKALAGGFVSSDVLATVRAKLTVLKGTITDQLDQIAQAARERSDLYKQTFSDLAQQALDAFTKETNDVLAHPEAHANILPLTAKLLGLQDAHTQQQLQDQLSQAEKHLADALAGATEDSSGVLAQARERLGKNVLAHALDVAQSAVLGITPGDMTDKILKDMQEVLTRSSTPNPDDVAKAQKEVADAKYEIEVYGLQKQAQAEQDAYRDSRTELQDHLQKSLGLWQTYFADLGHDSAQAFADLNAILAQFGLPGLPTSALTTPGGPPSSQSWQAQTGTTSGFSPGIPSDMLAGILFGTPGGINPSTGQPYVGFADGGISMSPMLARVSERGTPEAHLPLDDPRALEMVGRAIAAAGGVRGGDGVTVLVSVQDEKLRDLIQVEVLNAQPDLSYAQGSNAERLRREGRTA